MRRSYKTFFMLVILALTVPRVAVGQTISLELKAGAQLGTLVSELEAENFQWRAGWLAGLGVGFGSVAHPKITFVVEVMVGEKGAVQIAQPGDVRLVWQSTVVQIPLLAKFQFVPPEREVAPYVFGGIAYGRRVATTLTNLSGEVDYDEFVNHDDFDVVVGAGVRWKHVLAEVRYHHGLSDLSNTIFAPIRRFRTIAVLGGYSFGK